MKFLNFSPNFISLSPKYGEEVGFEISGWVSKFRQFKIRQIVRQVTFPRFGYLAGFVGRLLYLLGAFVGRLLYLGAFGFLGFFGE